jgi:hypothetical protein
MVDLYQKPEEAASIFSKLMSKFGDNLDSSLRIFADQLAATEVRARACAEVGRILREGPASTSTQHEITCIFDEVFGDLYIRA